VGRQLLEEAIVTLGVLQASVLGLLLFLTYIHDIWRHTELTITLFTDDCIIYIYKTILNNNDLENNIVFQHPVCTFLIHLMKR
jgi:hypothetical protein